MPRVNVLANTAFMALHIHIDFLLAQLMFFQYKLCDLKENLLIKIHLLQVDSFIFLGY